jgi:hypothetical protein
VGVLRYYSALYERNYCSSFIQSIMAQWYNTFPSPTKEVFGSIPKIIKLYYFYENIFIFYIKIYSAKYVEIVQELMVQWLGSCTSETKVHGSRPACRNYNIIVIFSLTQNESWKNYFYTKYCLLFFYIFVLFLLLLFRELRNISFFPCLDPSIFVYFEPSL